MTVKTEATAFTPTANARAVAQAKGVNLDVLMQQLQLAAIEMQTLLKEIIKVHPVGGGDAANLTALNAILTELL